MYYVFFQGIKWIKNKYGKKLTVLRLGQKFFMDKVELCVAEGRTLLLENLCEEIDPVLDPLLGMTIRVVEFSNGGYKIRKSFI